MKNVEIKTEFIKLDSFLKWAEIACLGSEAKFLVQEGMILVNGEVETRRGRKLYNDDIVEFEGESYKVVQP